MLFAGIDIGSTSVNTVFLDENENVAAYDISPTGANSRTAGQKSLDATLEKAGVSMDALSFIVATGYGRISAPFANKQITEITCHGRGAHRLFPGTKTIIDIGGQDSKVIRLDGDGKVEDFAMNDKCAAGTGRFLEVMARALEVPLDSLGAFSKTSTQEIAISSMCTVFAESEVISLVADGRPREDIVNGIHNAICNRISGMVDRMGIVPEVTITGGVAKNSAIVRELNRMLAISLNVPEEPQIAGALGAALFAKDFAAKQ